MEEETFVKEEPVEEVPEPIESVEPVEVVVEEEKKAEIQEDSYEEIDFSNIDTE